MSTTSPDTGTDNWWLVVGWRLVVGGGWLVVGGLVGGWVGGLVGWLVARFCAHRCSATRSLRTSMTPAFPGLLSWVLYRSRCLRGKAEGFS